MFGRRVGASKKRQVPNALWKRKLLSRPLNCPCLFWVLSLQKKSFAVPTTSSLCHPASSHKSSRSSRKASPTDFFSDATELKTVLFETPFDWQYNDVQLSRNSGFMCANGSAAADTVFRARNRRKIGHPKIRLFSAKIPARWSLLMRIRICNMFSS